MTEIQYLNKNDDKVIVFPNSNPNMLEQNIAALYGPFEADSSIPKPVLDHCFDAYVMNLLGSLIDVGFRFTEERQACMFRVTVEMVKAVVYRNQGIPHDLIPLLEDLVPDEDME